MQNTSLQLYRKLLKQVEYIHKIEKQIQYRKQIQQEFRQYIAEPNEQRILELQNKAQEKLQFLKTVSIKTKIKPNNEPKTSTKDGSKIFVLDDRGELVSLDELQQKSKALSNWREGNIDPDALKRHQHLLDRMNFKAGPLKDYPKHVHGRTKW